MTLFHIYLANLSSALYVQVYLKAGPMRYSGLELGFLLVNSHQFMRNVCPQRPAAIVDSHTPSQLKISIVYYR